MKKISAMILTVVMMFSFSSIVASAQDVNEKTEHDAIFGNEQIQPRYVASCPGGGKHKMTGRGKCWIYAGSYQKPGKLLVTGFARQCLSCHLVLGSEYQVANTKKIGKYALLNSSGKVADAGVKIYGGLTGTFSGNIATDSYWSGFDFGY